MDYWVQKIAGTFLTVLILGSLVIQGCKEESEDALPYYNNPDFTPVFRSKDALQDLHTIGNFRLTDQDSSLITQKDIEGKIHVANFIFTSCGSICPVMTKNMKLVNDAFDGDNEILILSYSVTPWIDTPGVLSKYKKANLIQNPNWHFITGSKTEIYKLARRSYFAEEEMGYTKDSTEFLHTEHCLLVDKAKRIRGIYNGTLTLEMKQLIADIKVLKKE